MAEPKLVIVCVPSLVATLLNREQAKGSPLTKDEVLQVRNNAPAIALSINAARKVEEKRGYPDIDPENCWEEWIEARKTLNPPSH
jgi:hypothetical protein